MIMAFKFFWGTAVFYTESPNGSEYVAKKWEVKRLSLNHSQTQHHGSRSNGSRDEPTRQYTDLCRRLNAELHCRVLHVQLLCSPSPACRTSSVNKILSKKFIPNPQGDTTPFANLAAENAWTGTAYVRQAAGP